MNDITNRLKLRSDPDSRDAIDEIVRLRTERDALQTENEQLRNDYGNIVAELGLIIVEERATNTALQQQLDTLTTPETDRPTGGN